MALNLDSIPPGRKKSLITLGEGYGSQDTLDQANATIDASKKHAALLKTMGFTALHITQLEDARDALLDAGVGRDTAKGTKKVRGQAYTDAMSQALTARITARTVLQAVKEDLEGLTDASSVDAERAASTALSKTRVAPTRKAEQLARQLTQILTALKQPTVAAGAAGQGGPDAVADVEAAITALRKADQEDVGRRGTPVETATLDLIDGIIVQLVRRARRAADAAGKKTGNPALVEEFKLDKLYRSRGGAPVEEEEPVEEPGDDEEEK